MILVAHAIVDGIVSAENGAVVGEGARAPLVDWLASKDIQTGDHVLIVRDLDRPGEHS